MKRICAGICGLLLLSLVGCSGGGTSGGQTTAAKDGNPIGQGEGTFKLSVPMTSTSLKQGEVKEVTIGIDKGKNFSEDVELTFTGQPNGVSFEPAKATLKASEKEVKVKVKAAEMAAEGKHTITVTGKPSKGAEAASKFDITVEKK